MYITYGSTSPVYISIVHSLMQPWSPDEHLVLVLAELISLMSCCSKMSLKLLVLLISLGLGHSQTVGTVCNETGQLSELQKSISAIKKDVDALRSLTKLLLHHYMLPHEIQSSADQCTTTDQLEHGTHQNPASSCQQIAEDNPSSLPGYFWVTSGSDSPAFVYCTPNTHCSTNVTVQGWMRVANLDMTDPRQGCPTGFKLTTSPKRGCFRTTTPGCTSVTFDTHNITYNKVCGRVIGYSYLSLDAFEYHDRLDTIDGTYVDGVSITHGHSPRQHIWTFAGTTYSSCPCARAGVGVVPSFINNEYFCEAGNATKPMWDGGDCPSTSTCCTFNNPPWFCKQLSQNTTDDIEVRVCADQESADEDIQIELIELYVQ